MRSSQTVTSFHVLSKRVSRINKSVIRELGSSLVERKKREYDPPHLNDTSVCVCVKLRQNAPSDLSSKTERGRDSKYSGSGAKMRTKRRNRRWCKGDGGGEKKKRQGDGEDKSSKDSPGRTNHSEHRWIRRFKKPVSVPLGGRCICDCS